MSKWKIVSIATALALVIAGASLFGFNAVANAATMKAEDLQTITQSSTGPGLLGDGYLAHGGWGRGGPRAEIDYQQLLADALGITVDKLQTAYDDARTAAIEQAVKEGLITQEQADNMTVWGSKGRGGFCLPFLGHKTEVKSDTIDEEALLAGALGITTDELSAAREKANEAAIAQAIEQGIITQEQVDEMQSRRALQSYLNRDALLAKALGMTVEDLQAAYKEGKTLTDLLSEKGLDAATVRDKVQEAYTEALAQAVKDGVITQEQADEMKNDMGRSFGGPMMGPHPDGKFGGRDSSRMRPDFGKRGDWQGQQPSAPDQGNGSDDDTSGMNWHHPSRGAQAGSSL
jgi:formaldehyde-activating enzyme involved in methanogenesis